MRITGALVLFTLLLAVSAAGAVELYANGRHVVANPGVVVEEGVSYGPLRAVAEAVGAKVEWNEAQQAAIICRGEACTRVKASEGIIRGNRLLLPIRKLAEALGGTVRWTGGANARIDITMPAA